VELIFYFITLNLDLNKIRMTFSLLSRHDFTFQFDEIFERSRLFIALTSLSIDSKVSFNF